MTRYLIHLSLPLVLMLQTGCAQMSTMTKHYREIGTPDLDFIAMIRTNRANSSEVVYNTRICEQIGKACGFFRSQAYAHVPLNHRPFLAPDQYPQSMVREADCWAARNAPVDEVVAAVELLNNTQRIQELPVTGDATARAGHIKRCAIEAGNWAGNT